jgi:hypothetical protein
MYIGYMQFFLIGIVFLQSFKDKPWGEFIFNYSLIAIPVALFLFIVLSLILGYLDSRLGFRKEELRNLSSSNPVLMEILTSLNELREEVKNAQITRPDK